MCLRAPFPFGEGWGEAVTILTPLSSLLKKSAPRFRYCKDTIKSKHQPTREMEA